MALVVEKTKYAEYDYKYLFSKVKTCIEASEMLYKNNHGDKPGGASVKKTMAIQMVLSELNIAPLEQPYYHEMIDDIIEGIFDIKKNGINVNSQSQRSMCWNSCFLCLQMAKPKTKAEAADAQA
jgi:hypothetical protein